jgi:hypothetical protein
LLLAVSLSAVFCLPLLALGKEAPLTNEDVAALVAAGLSESTVIQKIQQAPHEALDVSVEALVELAEAGVDETVIDAMISRVSARGASESQAGGGSEAVREPLPATPGAVGQDEKPSRWKLWKRDGSGSGATDDPGAPRDSFLRSGDYREGEEIVDVFLHAPEYARMREEFEFGPVEFDWGWVHGTYGGRSGKKLTGLSFSIRDYSTATIKVGNYSPGLVAGLEEEVGKYFAAALERLGLTVVGENAKADLELGVGIVDYKADKTYAYVAMIDPFIELEVRLRDLRAGRDLVLIRNQDHGNTPLEGAGDTAASLMLLLQ